jgi:hypothetical protein
MLTGGAFQRVRPLEGIWSSNLHLPPVARLRADDQNPPIPGPIRKRVLNHCSDFTLHCSIARVLHLDRNCHTAPKISPPLPLPQTMRHPREDSAAESPTTEYDRGLWRYRLLSPL